MSGWVKFEKDLTTDPRVLRMAKELDRRLTMFGSGVEFDPCNASALPGVTLVCGALIRMWCYADSHAREDDTLDLGFQEIDELIGIPGFCSIMPGDWLRKVDDRTVELPGFQEHNGVEAKKRALTQKRVARHRHAEKRISVTSCNASALPDQDQDQDQTKTKTRERDVARDAAPAEHGDSTGPEAVPRETAYRSHWLAVRDAYPPNPLRANWIGAERNALRLIESGQANWPALIAGTERYAAARKADGLSVMNPERFFGAEDRPWAQAWPIHAKPAKPKRGGLTESAKRWGEDPPPEEANAGN